MAGIAPEDSATAASLSSLSVQQFRTIAWLRWRIFSNSLRFKGAMGELLAKILSYLLLAVVVFGPAVGVGFVTFLLVRKGYDAYLAIPLWVIFMLWQFVGASTSATGPSFDLSSLIRFPLRYRDYLLMRLSFGLLDPPTLGGIVCLLAMTLGLALAAPRMLAWAGLGFFSYGLCLILFSRMVYSWTERWLARRKTRELLTGAILLGSLAIQFAAQFVQRLSRVGEKPLSPFLLKTGKILIAVNWLLPPGLTASSIDHMGRGLAWTAVAAMLAVLAYAAGFLWILHLRLHAEYLGESLSEAPAAAAARAKARTVRSSETRVATAGRDRALLSPAVAANLAKEIRYLLRSGPKLYVLIMPVFVVFLFSARNSSMNFIGLSQGIFKGMLFVYGCAYMQMIFVALLYNSLGSDAAGAQFYFIAPLRMRDVMLAKNLLTGGIMLIEIVLIYAVASFIAGAPPAATAAAAVTWSLFTFFLNTCIGNVRSIVAPKAMDPSKVRGQNVSGVSSLISLAVVLGSIGLGAALLWACNLVHVSFWPAAAVFLVLAGMSFGAYLLVLNKIDGIAQDHVEDLTRILAKPA